MFHNYLLAFYARGGGYIVRSIPHIEVCKVCRSAGGADRLPKHAHNPLKTILLPTASAARPGYAFTVAWRDSRMNKAVRRICDISLGCGAVPYCPPPAARYRIPYARAALHPAGLSGCPGCGYPSAPDAAPASGPLGGTKRRRNGPDPPGARKSEYRP